MYKTFKSLSASLVTRCRSAVLDGETVLLDAQGRPRFYDLLRRRAEPVFCAFDGLRLDGRDLRSMSLTERKAALGRIVAGHPRRLYAGHLERDGYALLMLVLRPGSGGHRGQALGRREMFEKRVGRK